MRRIVYFLFLVSYLNIVTLIPGSCAALAPSLDANGQMCIGDNHFDDYESIWEILMNDLLEQKDVQYESDDFPVSAHLFAKKAVVPKGDYSFTEPSFTHFQSDISDNIDSIHHHLLTQNSKNAFAQYYDYLFRLTPF